MDNPETEDFEPKDPQKQNPELEKHKKTPEEAAEDFLNTETAREGKELEQEGMFFQDIQKWQKAFYLKAVHLAQAAIAVAGGVLFFSPVSSDTGVEISKIVLLAAVAISSHFLERALTRSIKENKDGDEKKEDDEQNS